MKTGGGSRRSSSPRSTRPCSWPASCPRSRTSTGDDALRVGDPRHCRRALRAGRLDLGSQPRQPAISMGWTPEEGFHSYDWRGYNEAMISIILALGSPTHPVEPARMGRIHEDVSLGDFLGPGPTSLFAPLFGHQYSHVWIDFRGIRTRHARARQRLFRELPARHLAQRSYAIENPSGMERLRRRHLGAYRVRRSHGRDADDRTADPRTFYTYWPRAGPRAARQRRRHDRADRRRVVDRVRPEIVVPALAEMKRRWGDFLSTDTASWTRSTRR